MNIIRTLGLAGFALAAVVAQGRPAGAVEIGIYAGPGCDGLSHITSYESWLGSPNWHVTENFDQSSWANLMSDVPWSVGCYAPLQSVMGFTFSVPMLPADGSSTLAQGAAGAYDSYFKSIAETLVQNNFGTATIRLGWEFNGNWQPWSSYTDPTNFIRYFRHIVHVMKAVPGARFLIEWCPNIGTGMLAPTRSYPGDAYVDVIGIDVYDASWSSADADPVTRWNNYVTEPYGLAWHAAFALAHHKRLSMPEWGCCGNSTGDDPYFVNEMAAWLKSHGFLYADYWDSNSVYQGMLSQNQFPLAGAAYIADFK